MKTKRGTKDEYLQRCAADLARIQSGMSKNDELTVQLFAARGFPPAIIEPRQNVLTYNAWRAKGRHVRKGEKAVSVPIRIPVYGADPVTGERIVISTRPWTAYLFHELQTDLDAMPSTTAATTAQQETLCA